MLERMVLQPHEVEGRLRNSGINISVEFNDRLREWYLFFEDMEDYREFMRMTMNTSIFNEVEKSNTQIYLKHPSEPLEFGVITHIHDFEYWNDWEAMFHSLFTEMRV
jgi:hypothetical protein